MPYTPRAPISPLKLLISDIDGTLIHGNEYPPPSVIQAIHAAQASGLKIALASGRNSTEVLWFLDQLDLEGAYIALGGAYVANSITSEVLLDDRLPTDIIDPLLKMARPHDLDMMLEFPDEFVYFGEGGFFPELTQIVKASGLTHREWPDRWAEDKPAKVIMIGEEQQLIRIEKDLLEYKDTIEHSRSQAKFLDITRKGVNKGHAVQILADYCEIPIEQIVVIGDGWNDKSMFEVAGFSIAMGSGDENLHRYADIITPPTITNGFEWALERIISWIKPGSST